MATPPTEAVPTPSPRSLDQQFMRGLAWTGLSRLSTQFASWGAFLLAARLLSPNDFGIVAAATTTVGLVSLVSEFGLGTAIVAARELSDDQLRQLTGLGALMAVLAWLVCTGLAVPASLGLRVPELRTVLPVVGVTIGIATFNAVPLAALRRALSFKRVSAFEIARAFVSAGLVVLLTLAGAGFWALLLAELGANLTMLCLLLWGTRLVPQWPRVAEIRTSLGMSRDVLLSRVAWYSYSNADFAVVGRRIGKAALGDYSMAWTLINLPSEKIATLLFAVTPSIFARVRDDLPEFRRYVLLLLESMALLLMPASAGVALVAADAVGVVIGPQWVRAVPIIQALAVFAVVKSIAPLSAQILVSRGNTAAARRQSFVGLAVLPIGFVFASRQGAVAVALVWTTVYPLLVVYQMREALREIELTVAVAAQRVGPIVLATLLMSASVWTAQQLLVELSPAWRLGAAIGVGAVSYALGIALLARSRAQQTWAFLRRRS